MRCDFVLQLKRSAWPSRTYFQLFAPGRALPVQVDERATTGPGSRKCTDRPGSSPRMVANCLGGAIPKQYT